MNTDDINYYIPDDTRIVKWHLTDDNEIDYTIYKEVDGGRIEVTEDGSISTLLENIL